MGYIDLSRVNERTLDTLLSNAGIPTAGKNLPRKILEYNQRFGTSKASELYVDLNPPVEEPNTRMHKTKKMKTTRFSAGKKQQTSYERGSIECWDYVGIAKIRSNDGIVGTVHSPLAFQTLVSVYETHRTPRNPGDWETKYRPFTIPSTCPKIPTVFSRIKHDCEYKIESGKTIPDDSTRIDITSQGRVIISCEDFDSWYKTVLNWYRERNIHPNKVQLQNRLERQVRDYIEEISAGSFDLEKSRAILELAKTAVSIANQIYKSNPPSWKKGLIERVQGEIQRDLSSGSLDLYNRLSKTRFEKFLKDQGIKFDDVYEAVVKFVEKFGLDALIPFVKYDTAETSGCDAGIDYSPRYIMDFEVKPKARKVVYREENGFKATFLIDRSFESNFQMSYDIDEFAQFGDNVGDIYTLIRHKFNKPDEVEAQRYETKLHLRSYLEAIRNIREKKESFNARYSQDDSERYNRVSSALEQSYKIMGKLLSG
jgi:hypothetical protein